jgi:hypothetical protein
MKLLIDHRPATQIDDASFEKVLTFYPEEEMSKRSVFARAIQDGEIDFEDLKAEAEKLIIPWQLFFLDESKLRAELSRIESLRHKASSRLFAKRQGAGTVTSKRILDRLIRCQTFITENHTISKNRFCGSLKGRSIAQCVRHICEHFEINIGTFRSKNKADALAYLIEKIEGGQVNVCQGVLTNKILPALADSRSVYKNTSGFIVRDDSVPFLFIPSEINPDEREARQIFTLVFLATLIGLDAYDYHIEKDFKASMLSATGLKRAAYEITSELLLPTAISRSLQGTRVTANVRDKMARHYKLSPSAVVVILRKRNIISAKDYDALLPPPAPARPRKKSGATPSIELSVKKFNGKYSYEYIDRDFSSLKITPVQTQYLLFGSINKKGFKKYKKKLGL